jgi:quinohemoprotein amine dehydrogenase
MTRTPTLPWERALRAIALALLLPTPASFAADSTVKELLQTNCAACHADPAKPDAPLSRMGEQRKTPEGWEMTLRRMQLLHKVPFADPANTAATPDAVLARLVRHFADTQGIAPAESASYRFILERRHNTIDVPADAEYAVMCSRCHSAARVGLQRRTEDEWRNLIHFHLGQFPTTEYQAGGRDRDWYGTALNRTLPMLAQTYPLASKDWDAWAKAKKPELAGRWRLAGYMPGRGDFEGVLEAKRADDGDIALTLDGRFADGSTLAGSGRAIVYTGYEWRATIEAGTERWLQVLAASTDGNTMNGRMFLAEHEERGVDIAARKDDGAARILAVSPAQIRRGASATVTLAGTGLAGAPEFGAGIRVDRIVSQDKDRIVAEVSAAADAAPGARTVRAGKAALDGALVVFERIDRLEVNPAYAVGRVGGNGGSQPEVQAQFTALAFANGADGQPGTEDDLAIGRVPAAWSVAAWDEQAVADRDVDFAGSMDKDRGVFTPAAAGPNPARKYSTNNAGNLKVIAALQDGERAVSGEGRLLVTVQRWNNPPIR